MHAHRAPRFAQLLALTLAILVMATGLALADNIVADGDGVTPLGDNNMAFGNVCQGVATSKTFLAAAKRNGDAGSTNVFKDGSTVTVTAASSSSALSFTGGSITIPADWGAQPNNTLSPSTSGSVTITTNTLGAFSASVTVTGSGVNASNAAIDRTDNMSVSATIIACDSTPPDTTIVNKPNDPTNSQSASFTYTSTEAGTFQCSLDGAAFSSCPNAGITYSSLGAGSHTFQVRARDNATNLDPTPAGYTWMIDLSAPNTAIESAPPAITNQTGASFTYSSTESNSTFQCSLDGDAFTSCPAAGISYSSLGAGGHTFAVQASDQAGNTDPTAATHAWTIDLTPPAVSAPDLSDASDTGASPVDDKTKDDTPTLTGTAEVGSTVELLKGADVAGTTTVPVSGAWSFTLPSLADGSYTFKARATDPAGNSITSSGLTVLIDTAAPSISASAKKADLSAYVAGTWSNQNVTVTFACSDGGSGVDSSSDPVTKSDDGADQSATGSCSDVAGNSASTTYSDIDIDKTAPTITFFSRTPANGNGWNNSAVTVVWDCADALSGPTAPTLETTKSGEGADQSASGTCADNAGNTASDSLGGINIDLTDPTITLDSRTPANSYGWNNGSVTVIWTCADDLSGAAAATVSDTKAAEGAGQTASATCVDLAGNDASASEEDINIDLTAPTITFASRTAANSNGWNNGDVEVTWNCADDLSGVVSPTVSSTTTTEGENQTTAGTCFDKAGNYSTASLSDVNVDKTDPTITFVSRTPANGNDWNNGPVTVQWSCSDSLSGVEQTTVSDIVSSDGANQTASATCQDKAGNTKSASLSGINIDSVDPTITFVSRTPSANGNGWNDAAVTVLWNCADALSGPASPSASDTVSSEGANQTAEGTCADLAGNTAGASVTGINVDTSNPTITLKSRTPGANGNGWNNTDVTVVWDCADAVSGPESTTVSSTKTAELAGQTASGTCTDLAGNGASDSVGDINIDKTDPTIAFFSRTPGANGNGWNNSAVTVVWNCADALSGVEAAQVSDTKSSDGAGQTASGTCVDLAGNTKGATVGGINIDSGSPTITLNSRTPANGNGWNNTDVTVVWDCADALSDVVQAQVSDTKSTEAAGQTASGTCEDKAGNTASASLGGIKIDKTAPTVAYLSAASSPNGNGWYNADVTANFRATDNLSGFDATGTLTQDGSATTNGEGMAVAVDSPAFTDQAGNTAAAGAATSAAYKIDKTAPNNFVWYGGPAAGGSYYFGSVPAGPTCSADGGLSGLDTCAVTGYSNLVGSYTMTATATDKAGNSSTDTRSYNVLAWTMNGFFQPVDMSGIWNTVKSGSTVPLKWRMFSGTTEIKDVAMVKSVTAAVVACTGGTEDAVEEIVTTTGGTVLRYDGTQFIDNWKTSGKAGTCFRVTATAMDGSKISALFKLK